MAGFYTKSLQGKMFRIFRNMIMNLDGTEIERFHNAEKLSVLQNESHLNQTDVKSHDVPFKECVGVNRQTKVRNAGVVGQTKFRNQPGAKNIRNIPAGDNDVDTHQLVGMKKPMLMNRLRALASGSA